MRNNYYTLVKNAGARKDARQSPYGQKTPNRPGGYIHESDTRLDSRPRGQAAMGCRR